MSSNLIQVAYSSVTNDHGATAFHAVKQLMQRLIETPNFMGVQAEAHPLGFLCFRWSLNTVQTLRLHLWSIDFDWRQVPDWQIHDHVFGFESVVVHGELLNKCYEPAPLNQGPKRHWPIYEVAYRDGKSRLRDTRADVNMRIASTQVVRALNAYKIGVSVLHRTKLVSPMAISLVAASNATSQIASARVVGSCRGDELSFPRSTESIDVSSIVKRFSILMD
jgi:hypothetical protein